MNGRIVILLIAVASSSGAPSFAQTSFAQTAQTDATPAVQTAPHITDGRIRQGDDALPDEDNLYEEHAHAPPADPSGEEPDVTVGAGSSVDRAPRDIRDPFDE